MTHAKRKSMKTKTACTATLTWLSIPLQARAAEATHSGGLDWNQIIAFAFIGLVIGAVIAFFNRHR